MLMKEITVKEKSSSKKTKGGGGGRRKAVTKLVTKRVPCPSFFRLFYASLQDFDPEADGDDEAVKEGYRYRFDRRDDYTTAHVFRSEIIPFAIKWWTGEACDDGVVAPVVYM